MQLPPLLSQAPIKVAGMGSWPPKRFRSSSTAATIADRTDGLATETAALAELGLGDVSAEVVCAAGSGGASSGAMYAPMDRNNVSLEFAELPCESNASGVKVVATAMAIFFEGRYASV